MLKVPTAVRAVTLLGRRITLAALKGGMMANDNQAIQAGDQTSKKRSSSARQNQGRKTKKHKQDNGIVLNEGSNEEVLQLDVKALLKTIGSAKNSIDAVGDPDTTVELPALYSNLDLTVSELSSTGDGLALSPDSSHVYVIPFTIPGDTVTAKIFRHVPEDSHSLTDFIKVIKPSSVRDDSLVKCPYFAKCSGCQFQMLPYQYQLEHKRTVVRKAYRNFSNLSPESLPEIGETIGSPLQYGYRTKLTPHFDGPRNGRHGRKGGPRPSFTEVPPIGFNVKGTRKVLDIEDCPIGTQSLRSGLTRERKRVSEELDKFSRGATLLLRESTKRIPKVQHTETDILENKEKDPKSNEVIVEDRGDYLEEKTCITDSNAMTTEYVNDYKFSNTAGAFFQNNNSILPIFTQYIRDRILPSASDHPPISHLIDAYSGSGLFTITLSDLFQSSLGIDISPASIQSATQNLQGNGIDAKRASFLAADAANIFASVKFPAAETAVVIDPPRKGCDTNFLRQLVQYGPARIVYVSCNVHTQARDVGFLVGGMDDVDGGLGSGIGVYEMESLRGFDFFPQTGHVEAVAILQKKHLAVKMLL